MSTQTIQVATDNYRNGIKSLPTHRLKIDESYQRSLSRPKVKQIADNWITDVAGTILVARRRDGFYVIDGQHRVAAALRLGIPTLRCLIAEDCSTVAKEAECFHRSNTVRANPNTLTTFKARLGYYEPLAVAVHSIITEAGYSVKWGGSPHDSQPYMLRAVGACDRVYRGLGPLGKRIRHSPDLLRNTLDTITLAWNGAPRATQNHIILGLGTFYLYYGNDISVADVAERLQRVDPQVITREARVLSLSSLTAAAVARVILKYVNHRRAGHNRLPDRIELRA